MPRCNGTTRKGIRCSRIVPVHDDSCAEETCFCHQHKNTDNSDCSICLEAMRLNRKKVYTTSCNHTFHASCMKRWLANNDTCPYCRKVLSAENTSSSQEAIDHIRIMLINMLEEEARSSSRPQKNGFRGFIRSMMCMN